MSDACHLFSCQESTDKLLIQQFFSSVLQSSTENTSVICPVVGLPQVFLHYHENGCVYFESSLHMLLESNFRDTDFIGTNKFAWLDWHRQKI